MMSIPFIKMHGCGNDYVYLDGFTEQLTVNPGEFSQRVSCRHTGIGSDGLILMLPPNQPETHARMRMFNSDGSEGSMCGNAVRCVAMWLFQQLLAPGSMRISIGDRIVTALVEESNADHRTALVTVDMGPPSPMSISGPYRSLDHVCLVTADVPDYPALDLACVSMGNPHAVAFVDSLDQFPFNTVGPALERHSLFPDRANIEFVQRLSETHARVRVWERGSGETMACGSGACAVAAVGLQLGHFKQNERIQIDMRGGSLWIQQDHRQHLLMTGPAAESFRGSIAG